MQRIFNVQVHLSQKFKHYGYKKTANFGISRLSWVSDFILKKKKKLTSLMWRVDFKQIIY